MSLATSISQQQQKDESEVFFNVIKSIPQNGVCSPFNFHSFRAVTVFVPSRCSECVHTYYPWSEVVQCVKCGACCHRACMRSRASVCESHKFNQTAHSPLSEPRTLSLLKYALEVETGFWANRYHELLAAKSKYHQINITFSTANSNANSTLSSSSQFQNADMEASDADCSAVVTAAIYNPNSFLNFLCQSFFNIFFIATEKLVEHFQDESDKQDQENQKDQEDQQKKKSNQVDGGDEKSGFERERDVRDVFREELVLRSGRECLDVIAFHVIEFLPAHLRHSSEALISVYNAVDNYMLSLDNGRLYKLLFRAARGTCLREDRRLMNSVDEALLALQKESETEKESEVLVTSSVDVMDQVTVFLTGMDKLAQVIHALHFFSVSHSSHSETSKTERENGGSDEGIAEQARRKLNLDDEKIENNFSANSQHSLNSLDSDHGIFYDSTPRESSESLQHELEPPQTHIESKVEKKEETVEKNDILKSEMHILPAIKEETHKKVDKEKIHEGERVADSDEEEDEDEDDNASDNQDSIRNSDLEVPRSHSSPTTATSINSSPSSSISASSSSVALQGQKKKKKSAWYPGKYAVKAVKTIAITAVSVPIQLEDAVLTPFRHKSVDSLAMVFDGGEGEGQLGRKKNHSSSSLYSSSFLAPAATTAASINSALIGAVNWLPSQYINIMKSRVASQVDINAADLEKLNAELNKRIERDETTTSGSTEHEEERFEPVSTELLIKRLKYACLMSAKRKGECAWTAECVYMSAMVPEGEWLLGASGYALATLHTSLQV